jgi:hypothetical protein
MTPKHTGFSIFYAYGIVAAIGLLLMIVRGGLGLSDNAAAVLSLKAMIKTPVMAAPCAEAQAQPYPSIIYCLKTLEANNAAQAALAQIEKSKVVFPARRLLLASFQAELVGVSGESELACQLVTEIGDRLRLVDLATKSEKAAKWQDLENYLSCFERLNAGRGGVSPFTVSNLYFSLGRHAYEEAKDLTAARLFFEKSAKWYPTVWAAPFVMLAEIERREHGLEPAIQLLRPALQQATLPQSVFILSRQIGQYEDQLGHAAAAFCAYAQARKFGQSLAEVYAPRNWLVDLDQRLLQLEASGSGDLSKCP